MTTSFSWKRKATEKIVNFPVKSILGEDDNDRNFDNPSTSKRKKIALPDNSLLKSAELKNEGIKLAENGCFAEAVATWDKALGLAPSDAKIHEMKSQALLQIDEPFLALQAARKAAMLDPLWWIAHQTLGRAQLAIGEIKMAIISFSIAVHINPACEELRKEDLYYALQLLREKNKLLEEGKLPNKDNDVPDDIVHNNNDTSQ